MVSNALAKAKPEATYEAKATAIAETAVANARLVYGMMVPSASPLFSL